MERKFKVEIFQNGAGANLPVTWEVQEFQFGKWVRVRSGASSTRALAEMRSRDVLFDLEAEAVQEEQAEAFYRENVRGPIS